MKNCIHQRNATETHCECLSPRLLHTNPAAVDITFCKVCPYREKPAAGFFDATEQILRVQRAAPPKKNCGTCGKTAKSKAADSGIKQLPVGDSLARHITQWAVGINVAKRPVSTLQKCVDSVTKNGWQPVVFAEPGIDQIDGVEWIQRPRTIAPAVFDADQIGPDGQYGCHQNYIQTLADLLHRFPRAQAVVYIQDDAVFADGVREFLERDLWPVQQPGVVSPYCPNQSGYAMHGKHGCRPIKKASYLVAAQVYVFPRLVAKAIVGHSLSKSWKGAAGKGVVESIPWKRRCIDGFTGVVLGALNRQAYFYTPSMVDHYEPDEFKVSTKAGHNSTLPNHGKHRGKRAAYKYIGNNTTAGDVFPKPWVRWSINGSPSPEQRFPERTEVSTDPLWVIVPGFDSADLTVRCLDALKATGHPVHVCYVDNGSDDGNWQTAAAKVREFDRHTLIRNETNMGFTPAINQGVAAMKAERYGSHVLLLNNDCTVSKACLDRLRLHIEWHPSVASAGPLSADKGANSLRNKRNATEAQCSNYSGTPDAVQARLKRCRVEPRRMLPWFCTLLHRDAIQQLSVLPDQGALSSGLKVDDWWADVMTRRGWQHLLCFDAFAAHEHSATFRRKGINRGQLLRQAQAEIRRL